MYRLSPDSLQVTARGSLSKIISKSLLHFLLLYLKTDGAGGPLVTGLRYPRFPVRAVQSSLDPVGLLISCREAALVTVSVISFGPFATKVLGFPQSHGSLPPPWYAVLNMLLIYYPVVQLEILLDHSSLHVPLGTVGFYPPLRLTQHVYSASVFP